MINKDTDAREGINFIQNNKKVKMELNYGIFIPNKLITYDPVQNSSESPEKWQEMYLQIGRYIPDELNRKMKRYEYRTRISLSIYLNISKLLGINIYI